MKISEKECGEVDVVFLDIVRIYREFVVGDLLDWMCGRDYRYFYERLYVECLFRFVFVDEV